jgi:hypothetical protein
MKCQKCGRETGPAFGLCSTCISAEDVEKKLYVEYRLHFNPNANQDTLNELAEAFQEHIYDIWNNDAEHGAALDVNDVTYEIVMEVKESK